MKPHWGSLIVGILVGYLLLPQIVGAVSRRTA